MTPPNLFEVAYVALVVAVPAAVISVSASICAKRRAPRLFVSLISCAIIVTSVVVTISIRLLAPYREPTSLGHDLVGSSVSWGFIYLIPAALVWFWVRKSPSTRWVPVLAGLGVVVALPIGFVVGGLLE
jgi:hypothetical protein